MKSPGYSNIDELQARTSLQDAAALCSVPLDVKGSGKEVRIDCPFGCSGDHCGRKEIAINTENPQKVWQCHSYQCGFRGNLLTLMHGWLTRQRPSGDKLKGDEFRRLRDVLAGTTSVTPFRHVSPQPTERAPAPAVERKRNTALIDAPDERVRELHSIDEKFVVDVAKMNPAAASYVRKHLCLSSESLLRKWKCGYLPQDGGGDKRGWSLRGHLVYGVLSEDGRVLSWVGRDVHHDEKEREFARLLPHERTGKDPPGKHRFPKGFHRGLELYGQQASRLSEPGYRQFIADHGIIVVEGFNDVIGLDNHGIPAVGIMSNRITQQQVEKVATWAKQLSNGRVVLMFDCDDAGLDGMKEALWLLAQRQLDVRLAWSPGMHAGAFKSRQPESLRRDEWDETIAPAIAR